MQKKNSQYADAQGTGTAVGDYTLGLVIGQGGEGIVYEAEHPERGSILIKEYWPGQTVSRATDGRATAKQSRWDEDFRGGVRKFLNLGERLLAMPDHEGVMRVLDVFEAKQTAYWAIEFVEGKGLEQVLAEDGLNGSEDVVALADQLTDALRYLHHGGVLHRDVAPDNIIITKGFDWRAVLIDLNAAKDLVLSMTRSAAAVIKPGYSPIEQYDASAGEPVGPWSDIYGTGAVLYHAITGKPPLDARGRAYRTGHQTLVDLHPDGYDDGFLAAIDRALELRPNDRPQSIDEWRLELGLDGGIDEEVPEKKWWQTRKAAIAAGVAAALLVPAVAILTLGLPPFGSNVDDAERDAPVVAQTDENDPNCAPLEEASNIQICDEPGLIPNHVVILAEVSNPERATYLAATENCQTELCVAVAQARYHFASELTSQMMQQPSEDGDEPIALQLERQSAEDPQPIATAIAPTSAASPPSIICEAWQRNEGHRWLEFAEPYPSDTTRYSWIIDVELELIRSCSNSLTLNPTRSALNQLGESRSVYVTPSSYDNWYELNTPVENAEFYVTSLREARSEALKYQSVLDFGSQRLVKLKMVIRCRSNAESRDRRRITFRCAFWSRDYE